MPYKKINDLPDAVKQHLPSHACEIYLAAFNNAWDEYKNPHDRKNNASREEVAHRVAWSAVKKKYKKNEQTGDWQRLS